MAKITPNTVSGSSPKNENILSNFAKKKNKKNIPVISMNLIKDKAILNIIPRFVSANEKSSLSFSCIKRSVLILLKTIFAPGLFVVFFYRYSVNGRVVYYVHIKTFKFLFLIFHFAN